MINTVADLKKRTLAESNILKSLILSASEGSSAPTMDDILIHDYQIANSTTLNSIFVNYIVGIKWALRPVDGSSAADSYFQIVNGVLDGDRQKDLSDQTRLVLTVDDGNGQFHSRQLGWTCEELELGDDDETGHTIEFVNLDQTWYGKRRKIEGDVSYDFLHIVPGMNPSSSEGAGTFNPFLEGGLDHHLVDVEFGGKQEPNNFNEWLRFWNQKVNCIVENMFYRNEMQNGISEDGEEDTLSRALYLSRYIVCASDRLYGLQEERDKDGGFVQFVLHDIGACTKNLDQNAYAAKGYEFITCSFHSIADQTTMFVVFRDADEWHYAYLNESSFDQTYGFTSMRTLVTDQTVLGPSQVFSKVQSLRDMSGDVTIALTDYGFWDIEPNQTNEITYSFRGAGRKDIEVIGDVEFNGRKEKLVDPPCDVLETDRIVEYGRKWVVDEDGMYECHYASGETVPLYDRYLPQIRRNQKFVGGSRGFAVYDSIGSSPVTIFADLGDSFVRLLYSADSLRATITKWLYEQVTCHEPVEYGEYYLYSTYATAASRFNDYVNSKARFSGLQCQMDGSMIVDSFSSVKEILGNTSPATLQGYCTRLKELVTGSMPLSWVADVSKMESKVRQEFISSEYSSLRDAFVDEVLDHLQDSPATKSLSYFRQYLTQNFKTNSLNKPNSTEIEVKNGEDIVKAAQGYLKSKIPASLVIGGYDGTKAGNECYPGINSYIAYNRISLDKGDVLDIFSPANVKAQILAAVKSTPFFSAYDTYDKLRNAFNNPELNENMFKVSENVDFAKKTGLVDDDDCLKINQGGGSGWAALSNWLFPSVASDNLTPKTLLKALVRTQIYRPLFFDPDNHIDYTSDSGAYWCKTRKSHIRFDGMKCDLKFRDGTWEVDAERSGLGNSVDYTIADLDFSIQTNVLEYKVEFKPIQVVSGKFVHEDVEYYLTKGENGASLYFNEFQKDVTAGNDWIQIEDGKFSLNGKTYTIDGDTIYVDAVEGFSSEEYACRILDSGKFSLDGVDYVIEGGRIRYASVDDNRLIEIPIDGNGYGMYEPWRMEFKFDWTQDTVTIIHDHQTTAIDQVVSESCEFDGVKVEIDSNKTYDWWFAHAVMNLMDKHPSQFTGAKALGNGVLYDGGLLLDNQNGTGCSIRFENMVQEGYVVTKAFLRKRASGDAEWSELPLGVVFDKDMKTAAGAVINGKLENGLIGLGSDGNLTFLLKDVHGGKNDVNAVWTEDSTWDANVRVVEKVGSISDITPDGSDLSEFSVYFNDSLGEHAPASITISQLHSDDTMYDGMLFEVKTKSDGSQKYSVLSSDSNHIHVIVDGARYRLNLNDRTVDAFLINTMSAATIDFSTQYDWDRLIDGLTSSIKQTMMNQIVQTMANNGGSEEEMDIQTKDLDLYLDLFSDEVQAHNLGLAQSGIAEGGKNKFAEVYKNSLEGISEDGIANGKAYGYLNGKVAAVFDSSNSIELVNEPFFQVQRVDQRDDEFTYKVLLDLSFNVKKAAFTSTTDKTYIIGNATVHDIECDVKLTPEFAYGSSSTGTMRYTALYSIKGDSGSETHNATYDQIIYRYENKVRTRSVPAQTVKIRIPASAYPLTTTSTPTGIQYIVNEIVSGKVGRIFSESIFEAFAEAVNGASGHGSLQIAVVDTKNKQEGDGVWRLGEPLPSMSEMSENESIMDIQRGKTIIDGKTYYVSGDDDRRLIQEDGSDSCGIIDMDWHEWDAVNHEYSPYLVSAKVVVMNQIVSNADLVSNFTPSILPSTRNMLDASLSEVYLNFNSDRFPITSIGKMSLKFSQVKNLDGHNQRFYEKFGFMPPSSRSSQELLVLQRAGDSESSVLVGCRLDDHGIEFNYDVEMVSISMQTKSFRLTGVPYENDSDVVSTSAYSWTGIEGGFDVQLSNLNSGVFTRDIQVGDAVVWMSSTPTYGWVVSSITAPDPGADYPMRMVEIASGESRYSVPATELQVPQFSIGDEVIVRGSNGELLAGFHIVGIGYNDGLEYALEDSDGNPIAALESDLIRRYEPEDQVIWRKRETDQSTGKTSVRNMGEWVVRGIDDTTSPITYSIERGNEVETASIDDVFPKYGTLEVLDSNRTPGITFNFIPYYDSERRWERLLADYATFTTVDSGMLDYKNIDVDYSSQLNDEGVLVHRLSYRFRVPATEDYKILGIVPSSGKAYVDYDTGILVSSSDDGYDAVNVLGAFDFNGHPVDDLPYCFTQYPTNLNSDQAEDVSDLEYKRIYVELERVDDNQIVFSGDGGKRCPFTVQAIPPDASLQIEGDIYGRHYLVEEWIMANHATSANFAGNVILDSSGTAKTIRTKPTRTEHQNLTDDAVPESMSEAIETLVFNQTKLSTAYFGSALTQLKNFLELLESELNGSIDKDEMAGNCILKYTAQPQFNKYSADSSRWNQSGGMFHWQRGGQTYRSCLGAFNDRMQNDFYSDFSKVDSDVSPSQNADSYYPILNRNYHFEKRTYDFSVQNSILTFRQTIWEILSQLVGSAPSEDDLISRIFGKSSDAVRYINVVDTDVKYPVLKMYVADRQCHLFVQRDSGQILWYRFPCSESSIQALLESKVSSGGGYVYSPSIQPTDYPVVLDDGWCIRAANRDFTTLSSAADAYVVHMKDGAEDLWWLSSESCHIHSPSRIQDMAYEQHGRTLYVVFKGDNHIYKYSSISRIQDSDGKVQLLKENADMKIETFPTIDFSPSSSDVQCIYLDYQDPPPGSTSLNPDWTISLFGVHRGLNKFKEVWSRSPGSGINDFLQYNTIIFGDTLFSSGQLRFQNVSKNKDMYDMLDVRDIDHFYYGLFRNESDEAMGHDLYTVFRTDGVEGGNVQRLPFEIVSPTLYTTSDELYSLYALTQEDSGEVDSEGRTIYHPVLQEISAPNSPLYADRRIDIYDIIHRNDINPDETFRHDTYDIHDVIMTGFRLNNVQTSFFVLADQGFYKIGYENIFSRISIDTLAELKDRLNTSLKDNILQNHIEKCHLESQKDWFEAISKKVNQFDSTFSMFDLIPTEFRETQDIGVIPDSKVDDTDETTDHRVDSIQVSTDILQTQGMVVDSDSNPGIITAAVSNPATIYDDDNVFTKSQRNPLIEGTEFYDYIYDQDGNALMDLYGISFIYQVNSNNTYDLYINIPTTRTKYLNRVAGTLKSDLTSQVLAGDSHQRRNFLGESLPNNLDESTTRLKVFIDRKYISVGNVELVEICGNSIPLQIYRDSFNDGLYDSIALESRWNGEVEEIVQPEKDMNKVALEFECYGTDSQSIHIQGKTLIHHSLDDSRYLIK